MKINIIFHSMHGHVYRLAMAEAEGAREVSGTDVSVFQVPETLPEEIIKRMHAVETKKEFAHIPEATMETLEEADALIFGTPTRFGNMTAQMRNFMDQTGPLWAQGKLVGKVASVFTSTASQHGGQETTVVSFHFTLIHHGMIIVGVPYSEKSLLQMDEITGGTPYGATTIAGPDAKRQPTENELAIARFQGKNVAEITKKLIQGEK